MIPVHEELNFPWIDSGYEFTNDLSRTENYLCGEDFFQFPNQLRDWNAEYQSCKELPKETLQERILRDRSISKVTNEFVASAITGAKAIINGSVHPINPTDPKSAQLYIYNNIFFSHTLNGRFLFDEGEGDMGPYKLANNDLNGVRAYNFYDMENINTILTVLINYRGYRIVAQSIIPGILHQTSVDCIRYSSIDHGKTVVWNEEFHEIMKNVAKHFLTPEHEIEDESGNRIKTFCSTETKGVKGTDGRNYALDLDRITVRDLNFENGYSLVRLELYEIFTEWKKHHHILKHKKLLKEASDAKKQTENEQNENENENEKQKSSDENQENDNKQQQQENENDDQAAKEKSIIDSIPEFEAPQFIPNAIGLRFGKYIDNDNGKAYDQIKELSEFLIDYVIPTMVNEILSNLTYPSDSSSLTTLFHSHGINLRYLGKVTQLLGDKKPYIRDLMIREMIARTTKHIFNTFIRNIDLSDTSDAISHFFNCFIRGAFMRNYNNPNTTVESHINEKYSLTPSKLWNDIDENVKIHFHYDLLKDSFQAAEYILPIIRLLAQKTGVILRNKSFDFYAHQPFTCDDIMGLFPIVKFHLPMNEAAHDLVQHGKTCIMKGRIDYAFECLTDALQIFHQTYGPMHPDTARCYAHLAMLLNHVGDYTQAIINQSKAIIILERTKGLDFYESAFEYVSNKNKNPS